MRHTLIALSLALGLVASPALGADVACTGIAGSLGISCTCGSGTCTHPSAAPTTSTALKLDGWPVPIVWVVVQVCPATGQALTGAGFDGDGFDVFFYDGGKWAKASVTAYKSPTTAVVNECAEVQFDAPARGFLVGSQRGYMLVVPTGAGTGALTIRMLPSSDKGPL